MAKVLHTGDTHIGFRQYGLEERRDDFAQAFLQVVQLALDEEVAAIIHAGDLFEDRNPGAEDLQATLQGLFTLKEAKVPFLGIVGNHEQRRGVQWIDLFENLSLAVHLRLEPFDLHGVPIYGLDFTGRRDVQPPICEGGVLVCHQLLDQVDLDGELALEKLWACGAPYVLLGDYHEHRSWRERDMLVTYCGSTERWMLDEKKHRGVNIIDLKNSRLERHELKTRRFLYIPSDEDPLQRIANSNVQGTVVVVYFNAAQPTIAEIEEFGYKHGALAVRVRDLRTPTEQPVEPSVNVEFGDVEQVISEALAKKNLSPVACEIDQIMRDLTIADSNVDPEVTALLERA
jgi:DNA repair exonuclease SbcCD nuclease subunit